MKEGGLIPDHEREIGTRAPRAPVRLFLYCGHFGFTERDCCPNCHASVPIAHVAPPPNRRRQPSRVLALICCNVQASLGIDLHQERGVWAQAAKMAKMERRLALELVLNRVSIEEESDGTAVDHGGES